MIISILLPDLRGGGVERIRLVLAHEFARHGHSVEFVLMHARGDLLNEANRAFSVVDLGIDRVRKVPLALARYLKQRQPDVLLTAMWPLTVLAPLGRMLSGHHCCLAVSEHNTLSVQYAPQGILHHLALRISMTCGYRLADVRLGVSSGVVSDISRLAAMRADDFHMIHNPVPARLTPTREATNRAEAQWAALPGARILSVGSFKAQKNHSLLLQAFARMTSHDDGAQLMLLGQGAAEDDLRALADELGISNRVIFAGFHPDPTPFYQTADLFVLSSNHEGFGNVIVEALACGTPVVSTDCPSGPAEILKDGEFGTLVPVGDEIALAEAMATALVSQHDSERLRARAMEFAPAIAAEQYLQLFTSRNHKTTAVQNHR
ncbi:glycosyltransferase [Pistricoccus aurantiacus]|uniref:glycosyltransferase n=1 Tax=Pistricoccus aurantiacus TaxID=1883414 RepID=UPI003643BCD1